jgi:hypothetical protein
MANSAHVAHVVTNPGFALSEMSRGYRTLSRTGAGPVAAARDATLSLVKLVPLSHFLTLSPPELKRSFLHEDGAPLLAHGDYATRGQLAGQIDRLALITSGVRCHGSGWTPLPHRQSAQPISRRDVARNQRQPSSVGGLRPRMQMSRHLTAKV